MIQRQGDRLRRFFKCPSPLKTPRIPPGFVGIAGDMHLHAPMCSNLQQTRQRYRGKHCSRLHHLRKIVIDLCKFCPWLFLLRSHYLSQPRSCVADRGANRSDTGQKRPGTITPRTNCKEKGSRKIYILYERENVDFVCMQ